MYIGTNVRIRKKWLEVPSTINYFFIKWDAKFVLKLQSILSNKHWSRCSKKLNKFLKVNNKLLNLIALSEKRKEDESEIKLF